MKYSFEYPHSAQSVNGRRRGRIAINDEHIAHTHHELMNRLHDNGRSVTVQATVDATSERVWAVAGSPSRLFSHQPRYAGLTALDAYRAREGGRYVIHRSHDGNVYDRIGEVLVDIPNYQLTVSDIDIVDPSVSGHFPSLFTVQVEEDLEDRDRCTLRIIYTTLGVVPPLIPAVLLLQLRSIQERSEEASPVR